MGLIILLVIVGSILIGNNLVIPEQSSVSSAISATEVKEVAVNALDNNSIPPATPGTNTLYVKAGTTGHETFTAGEIKTIPHYVYWDVPGEVFGYFLVGYERIDFDENVAEPIGVTSGGLFSTSISARGPGYAVVSLWYWFFDGNPINDPNRVAFNITWRGKQVGTTPLTYSITDSRGTTLRDYFLTGTVHNMQRVPTVVQYLPSDTTPPAITILNPFQCANYDWEQQFPISYYVTDPESGIKEVSSRIDITVVKNNSTVPASSLGYGNHILIVRAVNNVGLEAIAYVTFKVNLSSAGMAGIIDSYVAQGLIDNKGIGQSLKAKLPSHGDNPIAITNKLEVFINYLKTQTEKHIDAEIIPFLFQYVNNQLAQLSPPLTDLPQTLPYISKLDSYAKITLPDSNQAILIPLGRGEYTIQFNTTPDPNIIGFTTLNYQSPSASFQIGSHKITYNAWQDPNNPSTGTINLASCGLVTEHIANLFTLTVDGQTYGPYPLVMNSVGVQQWPDLDTASMCLYGHSVISSKVPYLSNADIEHVSVTHQNPIRKFEVKEKQMSPTWWSVELTVELNDCAVKPGVNLAITFTAEQIPSFSNEWMAFQPNPQIIIPVQNTTTYTTTTDVFYVGDKKKSSSCTVRYTAKPSFCNAREKTVTFTHDRE